MTHEQRREIHRMRKRLNIPKGIDLHAYPDGFIGWVATEIHRTPEYEAANGPIKRR